LSWSLYSSSIVFTIKTVHSRWSCLFFSICLNFWTLLLVSEWHTKSFLEKAWILLYQVHSNSLSKVFPTSKSPWRSRSSLERKCQHKNRTWAKAPFQSLLFWWTIWQNQIFAFSKQFQKESGRLCQQQR